MKSINKILAILPILASISCSSDVESIREETQNNPGRLNVTMSLLPSSDNGENQGTAEERAVNIDRLYFGTYAINRTLKHNILSAGVDNALVSATHYPGQSGPGVAARLPKNDYTQDFWIVAFSVPSKANKDFALGTVSNGSAYEIMWPGDTDGSVWTPKDDGVNNIPMAGANKIEHSWLAANYNDDIHSSSPLKLPTIPMTRAMAKIVIEDPYGIISQASLSTPNKGILTPYVGTWMGSESVVRPVAPTSAVTSFDQILKSPNGPSGETRQFIFYTYERSFLETSSDGSITGVKSATDEARKLVKLVSPDYGNYTVVFAPHNESDGKLDTNSNLLTAGNGVWSGVLRNHEYIFTVSKPQDMGIEITVHVKNWEYTKIETDL